MKLKRVIKSKYQLLDLVSEDLLSYFYFGTTINSDEHIFVWVYKKEYLSADIIKTLITLAEKQITIRNANILALLDYHYDGDCFYVIYEGDANSITLEAYLNENSQSSLAELWQFSTQLLIACLEMERAGLVHGLINLRTIFITPKKILKVSQIGFSLQILSEHFNQFEVIDECIFLAPEFLHQQHYSVQSDIYSFGMLLYLFFSGNWPYSYTSKIANLKKALLEDPIEFKKRKDMIPDRISYIISICLQKNSERRFTSFDSLVKHYKDSSRSKAPISLSNAANDDLVFELKSSIQKEKRKQVTGWLIKSILTLLFIVICSVSYYVSINYLTAIPDIVVPNVTGLSLSDAQGALKQHQLLATVGAEQYHSNIPKGFVIETKPSKGRLVKQQREVRLFVSKGPIQTLVPDVVGRSVLYAKRYLQEKSDFLSVVAKEYSVKYPKGYIVHQTPSKNTVLAPSQNIEVVVSNGLPIKVDVRKTRSRFYQEKSDLRRVLISFFLLSDWESYDVTIYYTFRKEMEKIYSDHHVPGDQVDLEFELDLGGIIEVYFNDESVYKQILEDKKDDDIKALKTPLVKN